MRLYSDLADQVEIMIESSLNAKVEREDLDPSVDSVWIWHPKKSQLEKVEDRKKANEAKKA